MLEHLKSLMRKELLQTRNVPASEGDVSQTIVARQPIFDKDDKIWGYELLYRSAQNTQTAEISSGAVATASVIINGFEAVRPSVKKTQKILINFTSAMLTAQASTLLPPEMCVVEILEDVEPTPDIMEAVAAIKEAGYLIAVDDYIGQDNLLPFLPLADILKVDVLELTPKELATQMVRIRGSKFAGTLLAEKVENQKSLALCRGLGFSLFQGFFFSKPEVIHGKKVSTSRAMRMQILALCASDEINIRAISDAILHDPLITANLLKFINSSHFGLREKVRSVQHALAIVGPAIFMQWLCVSVLATMENSRISSEVAFLASIRGKFLESLGRGLIERDALPPDLSVPALFLAGLFSLLESIMHMPFSEILKGIPLDPNVLMALQGHESPYRPWLWLVEFHEHGEWEQCMKIAQQLNLSESDIAVAYAKALQWSSAFFGETQ